MSEALQRKASVNKLLDRVRSQPRSAPSSTTPTLTQNEKLLQDAVSEWTSVLRAAEQKGLISTKRDAERVLLTYLQERAAKQRWVVDCITAFRTSLIIFLGGGQYSIRFCRESPANDVTVIDIEQKKSNFSAPTIDDSFQVSHTLVTSELRDTVRKALFRHLLDLHAPGDKTSSVDALGVLLIADKEHYLYIPQEDREGCRVASCLWNLALSLRQRSRLAVQFVHH